MSPPPRILVTGDRRWFCLDMARRIVERLIARYGPNLVIVHGAATGVDSAFAAACRTLSIAHEPHPADWSLGRRAGPLRNGAMVRSGVSLVVAVHRDLSGSRGTRDCVRQALTAGLPVCVVDSEACEPRWVKEVEG